MKISSPAYMLPKSRSDNDSGFASERDDLEHEVERDDERCRDACPTPFVGGAIGCIVNSLPKPMPPLTLIE